MVHAELESLRAQIAQTVLSDRARLDRDWQRLRSQLGRQQDITAALASLRARIERSVSIVQSRISTPLRLQYDAELPVSAHREQILALLRDHPVLVVSGATGSGKSTQLPKMCLEAGLGRFGMIGHTQPRRIAARALANRLATELDSPVGTAVGYQVRFTDHTGPNCRVKLMTDGILLRELEADRDLRRYDALIIDEAHERSLNIDLLLGVLRQLLQRRSDLKLIVTSATIDTQRFAEFFGGAPVLDIAGRTYPVELRYRPLISDDDEEVELSLPEGVLAAVQELERDTRGERGDVLVFLPGEKQIRDVAKQLDETRLQHTEVLPLYARLSVADQEKIFANHAKRRIVLATNVAETSLTVPGIRYVIDSGLARVSRYSVRGKVQRLPIEKISQASANQRAGRCGRTAPGICVRLYDEADFLRREPFTAPEILRTNLASVILKLATLRLPAPEQFPFVDSPELRYINDGYRLLHELKAVDGSQHITALGKQLAALPLDPRLGRMLIAADHHRCLREMLIIAAFLAAQDPRERPQEMQQKADQHHLSYADPRSDFMTILVLWKRFHDSAAALSGNQLRKWCREQFLSFIRLREWQEVHAQLREAISELGLRLEHPEASYADLHQAILTGFLGGIGHLDEQREYLGARGTRFVIAPGTPLANKPPRWVVAASLVETQRMYARMVAAIEPQWIEAAGEHLLKRTYSEPQWDQARGFVSAFATTTLYGLILSSRRAVNYASVAPEPARELFVRAALVEAQSSLSAAFLEHNRQLLAQVHNIEERIRRRDVLVDESALVAFYLRRLPPQVHSVAAFQKWQRQGHGSDSALFMTMQDVLTRELDDYRPEDFPDQIELAGNQLPLSYRFDPSQDDDGVTITIPAPLLNPLQESQLLWLVPGRRAEVIAELLRALPKDMRKQLIPVPKFAIDALRAVANEATPMMALAAWISRQCATPFTEDDLLTLSIPNYLRAWIRVTDLQGTPLTQGRQLRELRRQVQQHPALLAPVAAPVAADLPRTGLKKWLCGDLPLTEQILHQGVKLTVFVALQDMGDHVDVVALPREEQANVCHAQGVLRLLMLGMPEQVRQVRKQCLAKRDLALLAQGVVQGALPEGLTERVFRECFLTNDARLPRTASEFAQCIERGRPLLHETAERILQQLQTMLIDWRAIRQSVQRLTAPAFVTSVADINDCMQQLVPADFLQSTSTLRFVHLQRYVRALHRRLERLPGNVARDLQLLKQIQPFEQHWLALLRQVPAGHAELEVLRMMVDEFRVSLFAQELKTAISVSAKRLDEQVLRVKRELARIN